MRFLRVAHLGLILARASVIGVAELALDVALGFPQRLLAERGRIRAVIGDETFDLTAADFKTLEEPLRDAHRAVGREAELSVRFLLQRRRRERRRGTLRRRPLFDVGHGPRQALLERLRQRDRIRLFQQADLVVPERARRRIEILAAREPIVAQADERRGELAAVALEARVEIPEAAPT